MKHILNQIRFVRKMLRWESLRVDFYRCPVCGPTILMKLNTGALSVFCVRCRANATTLSILQVLMEVVPELAKHDVYELSARGPLFAFLKRECGRLFFSEYYSDVAFGDFKEGVQCQDVQCLTFSDSSFDICTSTEVFEHVPDDVRGFAEIYRVLRPGGAFIFTVPIHLEQKTVERARMIDGKIQHMLPPEYHDDPIRGTGILSFRLYGTDIIEKLTGLGFKNVQIITIDYSRFWGLGQPVIVGYK